MSLLLLLRAPEAPPETTTSRIAVTQEYPPDKLAWRIKDPRTGQKIARWAADAPQPEDVINDTNLKGELNGGPKEAAGVLSRDPRELFTDTTPYLDVEIYVPGGEVVWDGRIGKEPERGLRKVADVVAEGHSVALEDNAGLIGLGYIDPDLSKFDTPSLERRQALIAAGTKESDVTVEVGRQDDGLSAPGIAMTFDLNAAGTHRAERWYYGGGVPLGALLHDFVGSTIDVAWEDFAGLSDNAQLTGGTDLSADYNQVSASNQQVLATTDSRRYALISSARVNAAAVVLHSWRNLRVLSRLAQGLALQGTWPEVGFLAKQMLADAIPRYSYLECDEDDLDDDGFIIQQAWYPGAGPLSAFVKDVCKYSPMDWFVRRKRFHRRFSGTYGRKWVADGSQPLPEEHGRDGARTWRSIVGSLQDVDGTTKTVGPPGSGADVEAPGLEITDPDHPAVRAEIVRNDLLVLGRISTPTRAIEACERFLVEANELSSSGTCQLSGFVRDDKGIRWPVSRVMEGDLIRFPKARDRSYRKIGNRDYTDKTKSGVYDLDAPSESTQALLERYEAALIPLGIG